MNRTELRTFLESVQEGRTSIDAGVATLAGWTVRDLGHARVDTQRELRCGFPEVIFGQGKSPSELVSIARAILDSHGRMLATRVDADGTRALLDALPQAREHTRARAVSVGLAPADRGEGCVLVVSAGTADGPVAEEACLTARMLGARTESLRDVGVAGIHRLLAETERLRAANVLVVVAGMEGALPSVVGGLVERPVIAVPTSIGYGMSLEGVTPLLAMLNSCAAGVTVVNVDNGFGAGYAAAQINRLAASAASTA